MITGSVTEELDAIVYLTLQGPNGEELTVPAEVDTGFDDYLVLPAEVVERLGLPWLSPAVAALAEGSQVALDYYGVTVLWHGTERKLPAIGPGHTCLLGMALLEGSELRIRVEPGGDVTIEVVAPGG